MASLGNYELQKKIATGGMAEVWLARQTGLGGFNRSLVVKRILPHLATDPQFVRMLLNEAKIVARLSHPNIAQIHDLGQADGEPFIVMEYVKGRNLGLVIRKAWNRGYWISQALALRVAAACCEGLSYAHSMTNEEDEPLCIVHRDISPQNILISFDGSVKLVDFGIAKAVDAACPTMSGELKGKFAYMSPEQAAGKALDYRSDLFALGLVLYELLTGVRPFQREGELATLAAAKMCEVAPPSSVTEEISPELDAIVMRALARRPEDRYQDAREFQMALEEYLVAQRWVATSLQLSELMDVLFRNKPQPSPRPALEAAAPEEYPQERRDPEVTHIIPVSSVARPVKTAQERAQPPGQALRTENFSSVGPEARVPPKRRTHRLEPRQAGGERRWSRRKAAPAAVSIQRRPTPPAVPAVAQSPAQRPAVAQSQVLGTARALGVQGLGALRSLLLAVRDWSLARVARLQS